MVSPILGETFIATKLDTDRSTKLIFRSNNAL